MSLADVLSWVLVPPAAIVFEDVAAWWRDHLEATRAIELPIDRAIAGAVRVDRLGYAFAGGYAAALRALVPSLDREAAICLAATEGGSAHPRSIATTLTRDCTIQGRKDFVTLAGAGGLVLVVAKRADHDEPASRSVGPGRSAARSTAGARDADTRPSLCLVRLPVSRAGVRIEPLPEAPFVPEIPHASLSLDSVRVEAEDVLPGDGYDDYLKPFRTVEDLHVHAALLAWLSAIAARHEWPHALRERLLAALTATRTLALADPKRAEVHLALGGLLRDVTALVADTEPHWATLTDADLRARWTRDRPLLAVAGKARAARLDKAWSTQR